MERLQVDLLLNEELLQREIACVRRDVARQRRERMTLGGALGAPIVDLDEQLDAVRLCGMVGLPGAPRNRSSPHARTPLRGSPGGGVVL